jgi:hypothetical protein
VGDTSRGARRRRREWAEQLQSTHRLARRILRHRHVLLAILTNNELEITSNLAVIGVVYIHMLANSIRRLSIHPFFGFSAIFKCDMEYTFLNTYFSLK